MAFRFYKNVVNLKITQSLRDHCGLRRLKLIQSYYAKGDVYVPRRMRMDPDYSTVIRYQRLGRTKSTGLNQAFGKRERGKGKGVRVLEGKKCKNIIHTGTLIIP